jgi:hypothetical protein
MPPRHVDWLGRNAPDRSASSARISQPRAEGPIAAADGEDDAAAGQQSDRLPQDLRASGVDVDDRFRIQYEPADRGGRTVD